MTQARAASISTLSISRIFAAPRELVFQAWTEPERLRKWWRVQADYTTPIAEVDLRVGGKYRLGMQAPDNEHPFVVGGTYREVLPMERLVYTWVWENDSEEGDSDFRPAETLVTVEFRDVGDKTEVVLTHEFFPDDDMKDQHGHGWNGGLDQPAQLVEGTNSWKT